MAYPDGLKDSLQTALDAVVPAGTTEALVENDTFGQEMIPLGA